MLDRMLICLVALQPCLCFAQAAQRPPATTRPTTSATRPGQPAARVAILIDATGSMLSKFPQEVRVARKILGALGAKQQFTVILFQDKQARPIFPAPVPATDDNKRRAAELLGRVKPHGGGSPDQAIVAALATRPDAVYLLSDGDFPDGQALMRQIRQRNAGGRTKIHTITMAGRHDPEEFSKVLRDIASQNGGQAHHPDEFLAGGK